MTDEPGSYGIDDALQRSWLRRGYWQTLASLRADRSSVTHDGAALRFADYAFEPATVFPNGTVPAAQVAEINLSGPSQLRLRSGEVLFVAHAGKETLMTFVNEHDLPVRRRRSVWSALLDPFLDTWESQPSIDAQFAWFEQIGLPRIAVDAWRNEVADAMIAYNFGTGLWEWVDLSLYDALRAQQARLSRDAFADFYVRAMRLPALDPELDGSLPASARTLSSAVSSVLIDWYPRAQPDAKDGAGQVQERAARTQALERRLTAELTTAYGESQRRYHTLAHIEHCLTELDGVWEHAIRLQEVRWAILFHDAIYAPQRQDNEARSAAWACKTMAELDRPQDEQERVRSLILATAHTGEPRTADEALLLDIDLSILGADEATFDAYDRAIRVEYDWVSESQYRDGRTHVLQSFLRRRPLYRTAIMRSRYETRARSNLQRALERLR